MGCHSGKAAAAPQPTSKKGGAPSTLLQGPQEQAKDVIKHDAATDNVQQEQVSYTETQPETQTAENVEVPAEKLADLQETVISHVEEAPETATIENATELHRQEVSLTENEQASAPQPLEAPVTPADAVGEHREEVQDEAGTSAKQAATPETCEPVVPALEGNDDCKTGGEIATVENKSVVPRRERLAVCC